MLLRMYQRWAAKRKWKVESSIVSMAMWLASKALP